MPAFAGMTAPPERGEAHVSANDLAMADGNLAASQFMQICHRPNVTRRVIAREGRRSSIPEEPMFNRRAAAYWIPAFAGMTAGAYDKRRLPAHGSAGQCHAPCHRPRRRAIQYCRGADDQSTRTGYPLSRV